MVRAGYGCDQAAPRPFRDWPLGGFAPQAQDHDPVCNVQHITQVVRDEDDAQTLLEKARDERDD
ncbi:hypothetical protein EN792_069700, partial [Mesorhizobium sp. M00.F.Ca.ET.149.01.1.1]